jgi:hypothetical protein
MFIVLTRLALTVVLLRLISSSGFDGFILYLCCLTLASLKFMIALLNCYIFWLVNYKLEVASLFVSRCGGLYVPVSVSV